MAATEELIVSNIAVMMPNGLMVDQPDAPTFFSSKRNGDGTWTVLVPVASK